MFPGPGGGGPQSRGSRKWVLRGAGSFPAGTSGGRAGGRRLPPPEAADGMAARRLAFLAALLGAAAAAAEVAGNETAPAAATAPAAGPGQGVASAPAGPATAAPSPPSGLLGLGLPALRRAFFVCLALAALGLLYYLGGRVFRTRKPARKKYGLLSNSEDNMEMASLESDEDTLFETRNLRR